MSIDVVALPSAPTSRAPTSSAPPASGFESALAAQLRAGGALPSVSLGTMVDALAGGSVPVDAANGAVAGLGGSEVAAAAIADPWGAAGSGRPDGVIDGIGAQVLEAGERYLGVPYTWGGTTAAGGFDCSGFVQQVYADLGVRLPRVSVDQARAGTAVASLDQARPGDLVFWQGNGSRPNHIGIYAGEGTMLVAPRSGDVVKYQEIRRPPDGIRRVVG